MSRPRVGRRKIAIGAWLLYVFAFLSGLAALVYQVAWSTMLSLTFGSTTLAVSSVVAGFMGGMGIGAWLYHLVSHRVRDPLTAYAWIEIGIAASTFALTLLLQVLPRVFADVAADLPWGMSFDLLRFAVVFLLLLIPSALMGATYPALCTTVIRSPSQVKRHLGALYGMNTIGAAAGALLAGFAMIELLGIRFSVVVANAVNLGIGLAALAVSFRSPTRDRPTAGATDAADEALPTSLPYWLTGTVLVGSGFATLAYEIVWFRALRYVVGNSTYALTDILVIFLIGLGLGALLLEPVMRRERPERSLALCQLGIGLLSILAIAGVQLVLTVPELRDRFSIFSIVFQVRPWQERLAITSGLAAALMLPATLLMGLSFPLASRLFLQNVRSLGRRVGGAYFLANLGSILGAVVGALLLLPHLGTVDGTRAVSALNLALGLGVLVASREVRRRLAVAAAFASVTVLLGLALPSRLSFEAGVLGERVLPNLVFEEEGDLATVQVRISDRNPRDRGMLIDGTPIAVSGIWMEPIARKQAVLAHLPMVLDTEIRRTLNIGVASCSTLQSLASYPGIESLDAVEINAAVLRAASLFEASAVLQDPRTRVAVEDAIHYLLRSRDGYDLIISDGKQNEDFSGTAKVLSKEFYEFSLARLSECGLFVQWITTQMQPASVELTLRTTLGVFPEVELFFDPPHSLYIVGARCPIWGRRQLSYPEFASLPAAQELRNFGIRSPAALLSRWLASGAQLRERLGPGPINSFDQMLIEFLVYRTSASQDTASRSLSLLASSEPGAAMPEQLALLSSENAEATATRKLLLAYLRKAEGDLSGTMALLRDALRDDPKNRDARSALQKLKRGR